MAQLVEQRIRNAWVPGSSPGIGSIRLLFHYLLAVIAQLAERWLPKPKVTGSSPAYRSFPFVYSSITSVAISENSQINDNFRLSHASHRKIMDNFARKSNPF